MSRNVTIQEAYWPWDSNNNVIWQTLKDPLIFSYSQLVLQLTLTNNLKYDQIGKQMM